MHGHSGTGKTQLLLHLLLSVQLPPPIGLSKRALYISTEADLPTNRLSQLLAEHTTFSEFPSDTQTPSLENVLSVTTVDLETQDHILNYQVPIAVPRYDVGLVVIDSITANYRVESSVDSVSGIVERSWELKKLGYLLRTLAVKHNIAVVVANQVSDRFDSSLDLPFATEGLHELPDHLLGQSTRLTSSPPLPTESSSQPQQVVNNSESHQLETFPTPSSAAEPRHSEPSPTSHHEDYYDDRPIIRIPKLDSILNFDYQQPFFTGWGNPSSHLRSRSFNPAQNLKNPALGLVWANQIGCRIVLKFKQDNRHHRVFGNSNHAVSEILAEPTSSDLTEIAAVMDRTEDTPVQPALFKGTALEIHDSQDEIISLPTSSRGTPNSQPNHSATSPQVNGGGITSPASQSKLRKRQMQVVFSPWATGIPYQPDKNCPRNTTSRELDSMYEPMEYEILPHGIRGIQ